MASPRGSHGQKVNLFQLVALLLAFVLAATVGGVLAAGLAIPAAAGAKAFTDTSVEVFNDLPTELEVPALQQTSTIYADDGKTVIARFYDQNRISVPLDKVSTPMREAMIAVEDKRFYEHGGIDLQGTFRAAVNNALGKNIQGASTLTQQYVKNVLIQQALAIQDPAARQTALTQATEQTNERKLREAKIAISLESKMSKDEILEGYLNIAQFGSRVYGVEAAAEYYFSKPASKLDYLEAATIAGITQAPNEYDPTLNPKDSQRRRNVVLSLMYQQGIITKKQYDSYTETPIKKTLKLGSVTNGCVAAKGAEFFCDYITRVIQNDDDGAFSKWGKTPAERISYLKTKGLSIVTTIDMKQQKIATKTVTGAVPDNKTSTTTDRDGKRKKVQLAGALTAVEPGTGRIQVMTQTQPYDPSSDPAKGSTSVNYSTDQAHGGSGGFQAGSAWKTFVLAEWLRTGHSLYDRVNGSTQTFPASAFHAYGCSGGWPDWSPGNSESYEGGMMSVEKATADSVNRAYASMTTKLDLCDLGRTADAIGFRGAAPASGNRVGAVVDTDALTAGKESMQGTQVTGPSMILGTQETSPLAMASAYATFASGGTYCEPVAIDSITSASGKELPVPSAHCDSEALDPQVAATVTYALRDVLSTGTARGNELAGGRAGVGKTGTTNGSSATWFVGYTPQLASAVWVGNPSASTWLQNISVKGSNVDDSKVKWLYGSTIAAPVWKRFTDAALEGEPNEPFPSPKWSAVSAPKAPSSSSTGSGNGGSGDSGKGDSGDSGKSDSGKGDSGKGDSGDSGKSDSGKSDSGDSGKSDSGDSGKGDSDKGGGRGDSGKGKGDSGDDD